MMRLNLSELVPVAVLRVLRALPDAHFVGGCVRDALLGVEPKDLDLVTPLPPEEVVRTAERVGGVTASITGVKTSTVTLWAGDSSVEVSSYCPAAGLAANLGERDFKVNAIACSLGGELFDPFNGLRDLREGVLTAVSRWSLVDDPVRVLRACRFAAELSLRIEAETWELMREEVPQVAASHHERVFAEFQKAWAGRHPDRFIENVWNIGFLQALDVQWINTVRGSVLGSAIRAGKEWVNWYGPSILWCYLLVFLKDSVDDDKSSVNGRVLRQLIPANGKRKAVCSVVRAVRAVSGNFLAMESHFWLVAESWFAEGNRVRSRHKFDKSNEKLWLEMSQRGWVGGNNVAGRELEGVMRSAWHEGDVRLFQAWVRHLFNRGGMHALIPSGSWLDGLFLVQQIAVSLYSFHTAFLDRLFTPASGIDIVFTGHDLLKFGGGHWAELSGEEFGRMLRWLEHEQLYRGATREQLEELASPNLFG